MSDPVIKLENVSSGYGDLKVLDDISFSLHQGSVIGIIGPNGHGKTTLLNTISGFVKVFKGDIRLDGQRMNRRQPHQIVANGIVHVPQGDLIFPEFTIAENLHIGGYLEASSEARTQALERVFSIFPKLALRYNQLASTLSGGERRMLALGRGLMTPRRALMIDEPSLGLAPIIIDQLYSVLHELKRQGQTILIVEENPDRVIDFADEILLIDNGSVAWRGNSEALKNMDGILETYLGV